MQTAGIIKHDTVVDPEIGSLTDDASGANVVEQPSFLDTADKARAYLNGLQAKAQIDRTLLQTREWFATTINDSINSPMFTFVDGDCHADERLGFPRSNRHVDDARQHEFQRRDTRAW